MKNVTIEKRLTVRGERMVIFIDVGHKTPEQQMRTVRRWRSVLRKKALQ